jgi:hypothetical protein
MFRGEQRQIRALDSYSVEPAAANAAARTTTNC